MRATRGFTLIEVLVALAIVAIGMAAVLETLTSSANTTVYLQDKTFAGWVALNRVETVRLSGTVPQAGTSDDNITYAGQSWAWQQKVTNTQIPGMVQIEINVKPSDSTAGDDRGWYASATGFMSSAIAPPTDPPTPPWSQNPMNGLPTSPAGQPSTTPTVTTPTGSQ
ncbi:MAG TPA: type II secretion system minor pseudopilin GspI [Steroidobacteraceae bacterium]|nr:type II secretion system minor pseudopilin GspI [Steroidobacteraceae bacterium]